MASSQIVAAWRNTDSYSDFYDAVYNLPLYRAIIFTLTYTFVVTPLLIILGFLFAITVNSLHQRLKGLVMFFQRQIVSGLTAGAVKG